MKNFSFSAFVLVLGLCTAACQKKADALAAPDEMIMAIVSPTEGQVFRVGEKVPLRATVSYPGELHGYEVTIQDPASGTALFSFDAHVHSDHFTIDTSWTASSSIPLNLTTTFKVAASHSGNEQSREVHFFLQP